MTTDTKPIVVVVEDDLFIREAWQIVIRDAQALLFASGGEFQQWLRGKPADLARVEFFVLDYYLESGVTGHDLAREIKQMSEAPVVLCSDMGSSSKPQAGFDLVIGKDPKNLAELSELYLKSLKRN